LSSFFVNPYVSEIDESCRSKRLEEEFIYVAPAPVFSWLKRFNDRMPGCVKMSGGMFVLRAIAATDVAARLAQA
jgi:hypothetical protein